MAEIWRVPAYNPNLRYFHAIAKGEARYDLQGQKSGEVTEEERLEAKASIKRCHERSEEKKRNRVIEAENQAKAKTRKIARKSDQNGNKLSG